MDSKQRKMSGENPEGASFVPTELGSARAVSQGREGSRDKVEVWTDPMEKGLPGPPWGLEPSVKSVCCQAGVDYHRFVEGLAENKSDNELAGEFSVSSDTIRNIRRLFYQNEALNGNYGQD